VAEAAVGVTASEEVKPEVVVEGVEEMVGFVE
jgi:hypothetical protein